MSPSPSSSSPAVSSEPVHRAPVPPETSPESDEVSPMKAGATKEEMPPSSPPAAAAVPCRVTCRAPKVEIDLHA
ncbi:hypothetical protein FOZ63_010132, partial [Perkinsus olseni]